MFTPTIFIRPEDAPPEQAIVRNVPGQFFQWSRPLFKAPPLDVQPPIADVASFTAEITRATKSDR
jgi:hypothetical protein